MLMLEMSSRIASTAAPSALFLSPRPTQRPAAIAAASVTRTSSKARFRSGRPEDAGGAGWNELLWASSGVGTRPTLGHPTKFSAPLRYFAGTPTGRARLVPGTSRETMKA